jgi:cytoskeleton protein RodZ
MPGAMPADEGSAGMRLRAARTAAGLSIDAVAQQLKLAPRQVRALEEDDFAQLPGRTFIRGFARNYARLLRLDPEIVLSAMPEPEHAPSLDRPSLAPTPRAMGELPADVHAKPGGARWAIPLALLAIIAIGVVYEFTRPDSDLARSLGLTRNRVTALPAPVPLPAPAVATDPAATGATPPAPAGEAPNPAVAAADTPAGAPPEVLPAPTASAADAPLVLVFRATSWVEVKDSKGTTLLSTMGYPGASHAVGGALPLEVVLGNAEAVQVTWRGATVDTAPHTRQNVAKFTLK